MIKLFARLFWTMSNKRWNNSWSSQWPGKSSTRKTPESLASVVSFIHLIIYKTKQKTGSRTPIYLINISDLQPALKHVSYTDWTAVASWRPTQHWTWLLDWPSSVVRRTKLSRCVRSMRACTVNPRPAPTTRKRRRKRAWRFVAVSQLSLTSWSFSAPLTNRATRQVKRGSYILRRHFTRAPPVTSSSGYDLPCSTSPLSRS